MLNPAIESRRHFFKQSLLGSTVLAAPAVIMSQNSSAQTIEPVLPPSPPTTPWRDELPIAIEPFAQTDLLADSSMLPQGIAHTEVGECGRNNHQHWDDFFGSPVLLPDQADLYELRAKADPQHVFHPDYPPQLMWNFEGKTQTGAPYPNPTFFARYGRPIIMRLYNELP